MESMDIITGSSGFIGSNLYKKVNNSNVIGIDKVESNFTDIVADLSEINIKIKCDVLFHLAAVADITESIKNPIDTYKNNVNSTINMLKNVDYNLIVFASTVGINSEIKNPYTLSKYTCEKIIENSGNNKKPYMILRFANIYGNGSKSVVNKFIENDNIKIYGGHQVRDFTYINDLINILIRISTGHFVSRYNRVSYIGTEVATPIDELADIINKIQHNKNIKFFPMRNYESIYPYIGSDFKCNTTLTQGIEDCIINKNF